MITEEQKGYIVNNYLDKDYQEIADDLNLTRPQVAYNIKLLRDAGIIPYKNAPLGLTEAQEQFIRDNYYSLSSSEIGDKIGLTTRQVQGWLQMHYKNRKRKHREFNNNYFNSIETPNQAYWLGFIYADGWISIKKAKAGLEGSHYEFAMELQRGDEYMLEELNNELGGKHIIKQIKKDFRIINNREVTHTETSLLRVYSKEIVMGLMSNGIDLNKTKSDTFPIVSDDLFPDFLRGYIDGDGCIHMMNGRTLAVHITGANLKCFEYLQNVLSERYDISTKIYKEDIAGYQTKYRLYCFRKDDAKRLLDMIYHDKNSIKLKRKYDKYVDFYGLAA